MNLVARCASGLFVVLALVACGDKGGGGASGSATASAAPAAKKTNKEKLIGTWKVSQETIDKMGKDIPEDKKKEFSDELKKMAIEFNADGKQYELEDGKRTDKEPKTWEVTKEEGNKLTIKTKSKESEWTFVDDDTIVGKEGEDEIKFVRK